MACLKLQPAAVKVGVDFLLTLKKRYNIISLTTLNVNTFFDFFLFFLFIFKKPVFLGFLAYSFKLYNLFFPKKIFNSS